MQISRSHLLAAVLALSAATISSAATFDAVTGFSSSNPSGTWSYGMGVTGTSFTPDNIFTASACDGVSGLSCWQPTNTAIGTPIVASNNTAGTLNFLTVVLPNNVLLVHPGPSVDSIVQWTAPSSGTYSVSGFFELLDVAPTGVIASIFAGGTQLYTGTLTNPAAKFPNTVGKSEAFSLTETLTAGTVLSFGVNNDGDFYDDSTGFDATITQVASPANTPEPMSLSLFFVGTTACALFIKRSKSSR